LRAFTSELVHFLGQRSQDPWDTKYPIPVEIKNELLEVKNILQNWSGRPFY
jgi:hypothetical protein